MPFSVLEIRGTQFRVAGLDVDHVAVLCPRFHTQCDADITILCIQVQIGSRNRMRVEIKHIGCADKQ